MKIHGYMTTIKFTTELTRDGFLKSYFVYIKEKKLILSDIELVGEERIYVNEHLNPSLQPLLNKTISHREDGSFVQVASHSSHLSIDCFDL